MTTSPPEFYKFFFNYYFYHEFINITELHYLANTLHVICGAQYRGSIAVLECNGHSLEKE